MKFIVKRASKTSGDPQCEGARIEYHPFQGDRLTDYWVIELANLDVLMQFVDTYGDIIIFPSDELYPLPQLWIYDSYVE